MESRAKRSRSENINLVQMSKNFHVYCASSFTPERIDVVKKLFFDHLGRDFKYRVVSSVMKLGPVKAYNLIVIAASSLSKRQKIRPGEGLRTEPANPGKEYSCAEFHDILSEVELEENVQWQGKLALL